MIDRGKYSVLGVEIDAVDYDGAVSRIITAAKGRRPFAVSALAVHGVMTGVLDRAHRFRLNSLDLVTPDGQPVRWAMNLLHKTKLAERVYGPDLMLKTCRKAAEEGLPVFLFGDKIWNARKAPRQFATGVSQSPHCWVSPVGIPYAFTERTR